METTFQTKNLEIPPHHMCEYRCMCTERLLMCSDVFDYLEIVAFMSKATVCRRSGKWAIKQNMNHSHLKTGKEDQKKDPFGKNYLHEPPGCKFIIYLTFIVLYYLLISSGLRLQKSAHLIRWLCFSVIHSISQKINIDGRIHRWIDG